jgi:hypothetical protein
MPRRREIGARGRHPALPLRRHRLEQGPGGIADFFLHRLVLVHLRVRGRVRLPIADIAVKFASRTCALKSDRTQPIGETAAHVFATFHVAVHDH